LVCEIFSFTALEPHVRHDECCSVRIAVNPLDSLFRRAGMTLNGIFTNPSTFDLPRVLDYI
jgi:hypothetical protein